MHPRQAKPDLLRRPVGWRLAMLAGLLGLAVGLVGCLEDAADQDYDYDNPNDSTPSDTSSDDEGGMSILHVNAFEDLVVIVNQAGSEQDMDGWRLTNENESEVFEFVGFTLGAGNAVRVHSSAGTDDANDLYMDVDDSIDWGNGDLNDVAILIDSGGSPVSNCQENQSCWP